MLRKLNKFLAVCGCLLLTLVVNGCGKNKDYVEYSYKGEVLETIEVLPMTGVMFDMTFVQKDGKEDIRHTSGVKYELSSDEFTTGTSGDYDFKVSGKTASFLNYRIPEGKYTFDLVVTYEDVEYEMDFDFTVLDAFDYVMTGIAEAIVEENDYDADLGYSTGLTTSGFGVLLMVDNAKDDSLEVFTMYSSGSIDVMVDMVIEEGDNFELQYTAEYNDSVIGTGSGEYVKSSITANLGVVPFSSYTGSSSDKSTHQQLCAQLVKMSLSAVHSYAAKLFPNLVVLSYPYVLGFTGYTI